MYRVIYLLLETGEHSSSDTRIKTKHKTKIRASILSEFRSNEFQLTVTERIMRGFTGKESVLLCKFFTGPTDLKNIKQSK